MKAVLLDPAKRIFQAHEESYTFLVLKLGYTWEQLTQLYIMSNQISALPKELREKHNRMTLTQVLKELENGSRQSL